MQSFKKEDKKNLQTGKNEDKVSLDDDLLESVSGGTDHDGGVPKRRDLPTGDNRLSISD